MSNDREQQVKEASKVAARKPEQDFHLSRTLCQGDVSVHCLRFREANVMVERKGLNGAPPVQPAFTGSVLDLVAMGMYALSGLNKHSGRASDESRRW